MPLIFEGKKYFSLKEAKRKFKIPQPTLYYWAVNKKCELLDLDKACTDTPFKPEDLRHQYYFEEESLMKAIQDLRGGKDGDGDRPG